MARTLNISARIACAITLAALLAAPAHAQLIGGGNVQGGGGGATAEIRISTAVRD